MIEPLASGPVPLAEVHEASDFDRQEPSLNRYHLHLLTKDIRKTLGR